MLSSLEVVGAIAAIVAAIAGVAGIVIQRREGKRRTLTEIVGLVGEIDVALRTGKPQAVWQEAQARLNAQLHNPGAKLPRTTELARTRLGSTQESQDLATAALQEALGALDNS